METLFNTAVQDNFTMCVRGLLNYFDRIILYSDDCGYIKHEYCQQDTDKENFIL